MCTLQKSSRLLLPPLPLGFKPLICFARHTKTYQTRLSLPSALVTDPMAENSIIHLFFHPPLLLTLP